MIRFLALVPFIALGLAGAASASSAAEPDPVILTIDGKIGSAAPVEFRKSDLEKLGISEIRTSTPWHEGEQTFEGVRLDKLMSKVGANGTRVHVVALNKYVTEIPISDFAEHGAILALKRNGEYMTVRNKGPLFVVFPFDSDPATKNEVYYSRAAWQVATMTVE